MAAPNSSRPGGNRPGGNRPGSSPRPGGNAPTEGDSPRGDRRNRNQQDNAASLAAAEEASEWQERTIQIRRVTKVVKGGKKMSFRAVVIVGNGKGQVGMGIGKSGEVIGAIQKGVVAAKKSLISVSLYNHTIPHPIRGEAGAGAVFLRPASEGTGVIAGGAARAVIELAGVENILSKSLGSSSPLNVARATLDGLKRLRTFKEMADARGIDLKEMLCL